MQMKHRIKKSGSSIAAIAALVMLATACSGSNGNSQPTAAPSAAPNASSSAAPAEGTSTLLSESPITYKWMATDRKEAPIRNDWPVFEKIREATNVSIEFEPVPDGIEEKQKILIATNSVPDFMQANRTDVRTYGPDGVFLDLGKYLDKAPNIQKFFEEYPEAKAVVTGADGGIYGLPIFEGRGFNVSWIVREDLMEKYGIKAPTNPDEFYEMLKTLKEHHPDTYPLVPYASTHNGEDRLFAPFLRAFTGLSGFLTVDPADSQYKFAPDHPGFKDTLLYLNKLYSEELLDPEFMIMKPAQWEERMLSGKGLVTWFWKARIPAFNLKMQEAGTIPGYKVNAIPLFAASGIEPYMYGRSLIGGGNIALSGNIKNPEVAVRFLDYLVSEEGSDYMRAGRR
jgi:putative aldouronate transport system substrate-binding protein